MAVTQTNAAQPAPRLTLGTLLILAVRQWPFTALAPGMALVLVYLGLQVLPATYVAQADLLYLPPEPPVPMQAAGTTDTTALTLETYRVLALSPGVLRSVRDAVAPGLTLERFTARCEVNVTREATLEQAPIPVLHLRARYDDPATAEAMVSQWAEILTARSRAWRQQALVETVAELETQAATTEANLLAAEDAVVTHRHDTGVTGHDLQRAAMETAYRTYYAQLTRLHTRISELEASLDSAWWFNPVPAHQLSVLREAVTTWTAAWTARAEAAQEIMEREPELLTLRVSVPEEAAWLLPEGRAETQLMREEPNSVYAMARQTRAVAELKLHQLAAADQRLETAQQQLTSEVPDAASAARLVGEALHIMTLVADREGPIAPLPPTVNDGAEDESDSPWLQRDVASPADVATWTRLRGESMALLDRLRSLEDDLRVIDADAAARTQTLSRLESRVEALGEVHAQVFTALERARLLQLQTRGDLIADDVAAPEQPEDAGKVLWALLAAAMTFGLALGWIALRFAWPRLQATAAQV